MKPKNRLGLFFGLLISFRQLFKKWQLRLKAPLYLLSLLLALVILITGLFFYRSQERAARRALAQQISAIAELKVQQIDSWIKERLGDALVLTQSPLFATELISWLQKPEEKAEEKIRKLLALTTEVYHYENIIILDDARNVRFSLRAALPALSPECLEVVERVAATGKPAFSDLHPESTAEPIHLDLVAPFFANRDNEAPIKGFVIFRADAGKFLFPLIQSWPVPSKTAETLLVRREGEEVVFLNELRYRKNTALKLRFPLTRKEIPAVRAALGETGFVEGRDYRGQKVIAYLQKVPSTPWSLVAKIDASEALAPWRTRSFLLIFLMLAILSAQLGVTELFFQRREKALYPELYQAEARLRESQELFRMLNESSLAGVYLIQEGLFRYVNQALATSFGYEPEELIDKLGPLDLTHPEDRPIVAENIRRRLEGQVKGVRYEFRGQRKDGSNFFAEVHGNIVSYQGKPAIIGNLIDITERKHLLEELRRRESELRSTLYSIGDAVITADLNGCLQMMNPVAEKMTGWTEAEAKGQPIKNVFRIINEFSRTPVENPVERVIKEGIVVGLANHSVLLSRDGREYPIADSGAPILSPEGKLLGVILVFRDQTAERQAQRRLEEAKEFAESIVATIRTPLLVLDPEFKIISANRSFYLTFKTGPEEIENRSLFEIDDGVWNIPELHQELKQVLPQNSTFEDLEITLETKTLGRRILLLNGRRLYHEQNRTRLILLAIEDITDRRRAEEELKKSEERFRRLAENAQDIIYRYTLIPQRGFEYVSPAAIQITGYTPEEHYADPDLGFKIVLEEDRPLLEAISSGKWEQPVVLRWRRKDGSIIWTEQRNVPIYDEEGKLIAIEGIARDVTERKKYEEALQASLREKEILMREIHHRVKNNMQVISSILNLQARYLTDPRTVAMFRQCQQRIRSMAMVHEKLYRSKDLTNIDFSEYLNSLAQTIFLDHQWQPGQVTLEINIEPVTLNINTAIPLGLILNELITNSLKHAFPEGRKGTIWINLQRLPESRILLQVRDDGVGIPADFDFRQADSLGMIIINTLVAQIDGRIELHRDGGTDFRIIFSEPQ